MRESRTYGFVRGVSGDRHPYRNSQIFAFELSLHLGVETRQGKAKGSSMKSNRSPFSVAHDRSPFDVLLVGSQAGERRSSYSSRASALSYTARDNPIAK